jgi:hypothetical protein
VQLTRSFIVVPVALVISGCVGRGAARTADSRAEPPLFMNVSYASHVGGAVRLLGTATESKASAEVLGAEIQGLHQWPAGWRDRRVYVEGTLRYLPPSPGVVAGWAQGKPDGTHVLEGATYRLSTPDDLLGVEAEYEGVAVETPQGSALRGDGWVARVPAVGRWPRDVGGHVVRVRGKARRDLTGQTSSLYLDRPQWRLAALEDLLEKQCVLVGLAITQNDDGWLVYRGTKLWVDGVKQWDVHYEWMVVEGRLARRMLPSIDRLGVDETPPLTEQFVMENATWHLLARTDSRGNPLPPPP